MDSRTVGNFFMVGGWGSFGGLIKNVGHLGWPMRKNKNNNIGSNALKKSPKNWDLHQNINNSKFHTCNSFFSNILFPHVPVDIISLFIPEFVAENLKANKNQQKRSLTLFTIQFRAKNLTYFRNLNSFEIENIILLKHSQKNFDKHVSVSCQKKHLHCTISWHPRFTFLKASIWIFVYTSLRNFCFKDSRFYLVLWGVGEGQ